MSPSQGSAGSCLQLTDSPQPGCEFPVARKLLNMAVGEGTECLGCKGFSDTGLPGASSLRLDQSAVLGGPLVPSLGRGGLPVRQAQGPARAPPGAVLATHSVSEPWIPHLRSGHVMLTTQAGQGLAQARNWKVLCKL